MKRVLAGGLVLFAATRFYGALEQQIFYSAVRGDSFVPGGAGWDPSKVKDGDYVVVFGHLAGPDEPHEMCPGGKPYVIDRMQPNP